MESFSYTTSEALLKDRTITYIRNTLPAPPPAAPLLEVPSWANTESIVEVYDDDEEEEEEMIELPDSTQTRKRRASTPPTTTDALMELRNPSSPQSKRLRLAKPPPPAQPEKTKGRKTPILWTEEENAALQKLIEEHGKAKMSWALLKKRDDKGPRILANRGKDDLKGRARKLKYGFLKARTALPANFEFVRLIKNQVDALRAAGIEYTQ